jgi:hypothetical protein
MTAEATAPRLSAGTISLAAAHQITPQVVATWWPGRRITPGVLVPIELDVLMVRDADLPWAQTAMTPPPQASPGSPGNPPPSNASDLAAPLFTPLQPPRSRGAYLQWYLPNWFTTGSASPSGTVTFPQVPDRWLVLRLYSTAGSAARLVRGWVLEAGAGAPPQPQDLAGWREPGPATDVENPLTALGHGDIAWLGYFDNVVNRFGFADAFLDADKVEGTVAYLVCGWFADPAADPLGAASVTSLSAFNAKMAELGWALDTGQLTELAPQAVHYAQVARAVGLPVAADEAATSVAEAVPPVSTGSGSADYTTDGSWWPTGCVLHGAAVNIGWPQATGDGEAGGPPDPASIKLVAGDTMAEAMGALIADHASSPDLAPVVEALQLGIFRELDQPDGRAQLDLATHASSFSSLVLDEPGQEPLDIAPSGPPPAAPASPPAPGQGIFAYPPVVSGGTAPPPPPPPPAAPSEPVSRGTGTFEVTAIESSADLAETHIYDGDLDTALENVGAGVTAPPSDPGGQVTASRPAPRYYLPKDPIVLVEGGGRSFAHDSTVQTDDGLIVCRLSTVTELSWAGAGSVARPSVTGQDVLDQGVQNGSVPLECEDLLAETVLLDPGSAAAIASAYGSQAGTAPGFSAPAAQAQITVEQTAWWSLRDPRADHAALLAKSGIAGTLPAPYAVSPASHPWNPLCLEWQVVFLPSPGGVTDWALGEIDYDLADADADAGLPDEAGVMLQGRSLLTGGATQSLSTAVQAAITQASRVAAAGTVPTGVTAFHSELAKNVSGSYQGMHPSQGADGTGSGGGSGDADGGGDGTVDAGLLTDIATALASLDVLSGGLDGLLLQLRGGVAPDGQSTAPGETVPTPFFGLRAGFLQFRRLRLVDGFGQYLDLIIDGKPAAGGLLVSAATSVPAPSVMGLAPRFTAPARATFRWMDGAWPGGTPLAEADYQTSPLCGFLLPNHLEGSLEFFNADGSSAGSLVPQPDGRDVWQDAPGAPSAAGQLPSRALASPFAAALAQGVIDWGLAGAGREPEAALSALLRTIDSTLWAVDPFGHQGDEHLSLLVGHPVCVMRAMLRLDVLDPVGTADSRVTAVPVRLGCLAQWQDGLLGYFVNDDYSTLYVADAAAAGMARPFGPGQGFLQQITAVPGFYESFASDLPAGATAGASAVTHPYVDTSGLASIRPGQVVPLTLLVEPLTSVYLTPGLVPRKEIGMRRAWVTGGLAAIAPTFRFGPVLTDPNQIRMPLATDLPGAWRWDARTDATTWEEEPTTNATDDALLSPDPPVATEGWLRLVPPPAGTS